MYAASRRSHPQNKSITPEPTARGTSQLGCALFERIELLEIAQTVWIRDGVTYRRRELSCADNLLDQCFNFLSIDRHGQLWHRDYEPRDMPATKTLPNCIPKALYQARRQYVRFLHHDKQEHRLICVNRWTPSTDAQCIRYKFVEWGCLHDRVYIRRAKSDTLRVKDTITAELLESSCRQAR